MKRTLRKVLIWVAALFVGLPLLLYMIVVAINWHDREPSPLAIKMMADYRTNSVVTKEDNGYVDVMGFSAAPDQDSYAIGFKRVEWVAKINQVGASKAGPDPQEKSYDFKSKRDAKVQAISSACTHDSHSRFAGLECVKAIQDTETLKAWITSESWLLERYQRLLARSIWIDEAPTDVDMAYQLPPFASVMEAQRLLLIKVMILAKENSTSEMQQLLANDYRFWRMVLSSTNFLITKMIATAALERHFALANIALRQLPPNVQQKAIPMEWRQPISDAEKSMRKVMTGEWMYASSVTRKLNDKNSEALNDVSDSNNFLDRWSSKICKPFYQPQATINGYAERNMQIADAADVAYQNLPGSLAKLDTDIKSQFVGGLTFRSMYNPIGQILVTIGAPAYSSYVRRVADIEGVRRATLAAIELREASVKLDEMPSALNKSSQRNPYTNEPFSWDTVEGVIVFKGLENGERGEHHIYYR